MVEIAAAMSQDARSHFRKWGVSDRRGAFLDGSGGVLSGNADHRQIAGLALLLSRFNSRC